MILRAFRKRRIAYLERRAHGLSLAPIGTPAKLDFVAKLPKTRNGKTVRRLPKAQDWP